MYRGTDHFLFLLAFHFQVNREPIHIGDANSSCLNEPLTPLFDENNDKRGL